MSFSALRSAIQSKLEGISNIQKVYNYPATPKQFPAATISPSDAEADYETTDENKRYYGFTVRVFYETKVGGTGNAVSALEGLIDEIVDEFDKDPSLSGTSFPSKYTMIQLTPTPSRWEYFEDQGYIMAEIRVEARISFDIT